MPILVTGASGSGKTSFASVTNAVDLDKYGFHTAIGEGSHGFKWIIPPKAVQDLIERGNVIHAGICNNVFHSVDVSVEDSHLPFDVVTYEPISEYYDKVIYLWYEPSDEELERRFGDDRDNPYGKDPETQAKIKDHLERTRGQTEFDGTETTVIDVTGCELEDLVEKVNSEIDSEVIETDPEEKKIPTPQTDEEIAQPEKREDKAEEVCVICGDDMLEGTTWHAHFDTDPVYEGTICLKHFDQVPEDAYPEIREKAIAITRHPEWFPDNRPNVSFRGLEAWAVENGVELDYTHDELIQLKETKKQEYLANSEEEEEEEEEVEYIDQSEPWKL